jgi:hypothetical protein
MSARKGRPGVYPSTDHAHLIERVPETERPTRVWTLRDDNNQHHHGVVSAAETPAIRLLWRASSDSPARVVGTYRLHLNELLEAGHVRSDPVEGSGDAVRIRFRHKNNVIYLQVNEDMPALPVGQIE